MRCAICGIEIDSPDKAILEDWVPYVMEGEEEQEGPFCAPCAEVLFELNEDGEFVLKKEYRGKVIFLDGEFEYMDEDDYDLAGIVLEYCDN
ncbi:MAG: hypothetical protein WAL98_04060 [Desulfatiglandaceae bacterium]|jgi:hypothetical protein